MEGRKYPMFTVQEICEMRKDEFTEEQIQKMNNKKKVQMDEKISRFIVKKYDKSESVKELRLLLLGKTGAGKSATGNFIVNRHVFKESPAAVACTSENKKKDVKVDDVMVTLFDTPGMCDTTRDEEEILGELGKIFNAYKDGIHGFLLVFNLGNPRYTAEERQAFNSVVKTFGGGDFLKHCFLILTHGDGMKERDSEGQRPISLEQKLKMEKGNPFGDFMNEDLHGRVIVIENHDTHPYFQNELRKQIIRMVSSTAGEPYQNEATKQYQYDAQETAAKLGEKDAPYAAVVEKVVSEYFLKVPAGQIPDLPERDSGFVEEDELNDEDPQHAKGIKRAVPKYRRPGDNDSIIRRRHNCVQEMQEILSKKGIQGVSEEAIEMVTRAQKKRLTDDKFLDKLKRFGLRLLKALGIHD